MEPFRTIPRKWDDTEQCYDSSSPCRTVSDVVRSNRVRKFLIMKLFRDQLSLLFDIHMKPLREAIQQHRMRYLKFADNTQLYNSAQSPVLVPGGYQCLDVKEPTQAHSLQDGVLWFQGPTVSGQSTLVLAQILGRVAILQSIIWEYSWTHSCCSMNKLNQGILNVYPYHIEQYYPIITVATVLTVLRHH